MAWLPVTATTKAMRQAAVGSTPRWRRSIDRTLGPPVLAVVVVVGVRQRQQGEGERGELVLVRRGEREVGHAVRARTEEVQVGSRVPAGHDQPPLRGALGQDPGGVVARDVLGGGLR